MNAWLEIVNRISNNRREQWDYILNMELIEFLNTVAFYTSKWNDFNKDLKRANTFEGAVLTHLSKLG